MKTNIEIFSPKVRFVTTPSSFHRFDGRKFLGDTAGGMRKPAAGGICIKDRKNK